VYVSSRGSPAGGALLRGRAGRAVFSTSGLFQSVLPGEAGRRAPPLVTNKVSGRALGAPFAVGLRGVVVPPTEAALERLGGDASDTVRVRFDPARVTLPGGATVRVGGASSVTLQTTYLDERVRLGRGSFGSRFVFQRDSGAERQGMSDVGRSKVGRGGQVAAAAVALALVALGAACAAGMLGLGPLAPAGPRLGRAPSALGQAAAAALRVAGAVLGFVALGVFRAVAAAMRVPDISNLTAEEVAAAGTAAGAPLPDEDSPLE